MKNCSVFRRNMKFNQWTIGLAALGLISMGSVARASVDISDLGNAEAGTAATSTSEWKAEAFDSGVSGAISSVTLVLTDETSSLQSVNVYLYNANSSGITTQAGYLGMVTLAAGEQGVSQTLTLSGVNIAPQNISSGAYYAIVLDMSSTPTNIGWDYANTSGTPSEIGATSWAAYNDKSGSSVPVNGTTWDGSKITAELRFVGLDVSPVPEPINEAMLIFGSVLALGGLGRYSWNRFKPTPAAAKA